MNKVIFIFPLILLMVAVPMAYARESDTKRASDGFNDGSNAARTDISFNPACDPLGLHTSDGQHTTIYCNAWVQGYTQTWNQLYQPTLIPQASGGPIIGPSQSPGALGQGQGQGSSNTCINVVNCNPTANQKQGATGEVNNGQ
jgi:hypothetical protein